MVATEKLKVCTKPDVPYAGRVVLDGKASDNCKTDHMDLNSVAISICEGEGDSQCAYNCITPVEDGECRKGQREYVREHGWGRFGEGDMTPKH